MTLRFPPEENFIGCIKLICIEILFTETYVLCKWTRFMRHLHKNVSFCKKYFYTY
ncbi:hypothetical protein C0J52_19322 [Blattella germanica]|nr:hypothetical protein C0J52_19322 [Blattella germanica]